MDLLRNSRATIESQDSITMRAILTLGTRKALKVVVLALRQLAAEMPASCTYEETAQPPSLSQGATCKHNVSMSYTHIDHFACDRRSVSPNYRTLIQANNTGSKKDFDKNHERSSSS